MASANPLLNALSFAKRGHPILPLYGVKDVSKDPQAPLDWPCMCGDPKCKSPGKHPHATLVPHGLKDATTDPDTIRAWFKTGPINYGVVCEHLCVIDVDKRNGGVEAWHDLKRKYADIHTWRVNTGGGGEHIIFGQYSDFNGGPIGNAKLARGVDIKGIGGYIVGPGSRHTSGKQYLWAPQCAPAPVASGGEHEFPKAMPPWLAEIAGARDELPKHDWKSESMADAPEGVRNISDAAFAGLLLRGGLSLPDLDDFLQWRNSRRSDPLEPNEVTRTAKSVLKTHLARGGR
jgi:hypothetical protein